MDATASISYAEDMTTDEPAEKKMRIGNTLTVAQSSDDLSGDVHYELSPVTFI